MEASDVEDTKLQRQTLVAATEKREQMPKQQMKIVLLPLTH